MSKILRAMAVVLSCTTISCAKPECHNSNAAFDRHSPGTKDYNEALLTQLSKANHNLTFLFDRLEESEGMEYIHADVIGDSICAKAVFTVLENKSGLTDLILAKGIGYSGAELKNLKFNVYRDSTRTELMLESVEAVVD